MTAMPLVAQVGEALGRPDLLHVGDRCYVAGTTKDGSIMIVLAKDTAPTVRCALAYNRHLRAAPAAIRMLAQDESNMTRRALASNACINACQDVIDTLSEDEDDAVRFFLAMNMAVASRPDVLARLRRDERVSVREAAARALRRLHGLKDDV